MPRHKHADCIIAWAEGKEIQVADSQGSWHDIPFLAGAGEAAPMFLEQNMYRIKPVKHTGWMCLYRNNSTGSVYGGPVYATQERARQAEALWRIAVIPIEFEETL